MRDTKDTHMTKCKYFMTKATFLNNSGFLEIEFLSRLMLILLFTHSSIYSGANRISKVWGASGGSRNLGGNMWPVRIAPVSCISL